jgi:hypothetical protein
VNWTAVLENDGRATSYKTGGGSEVQKEWMAWKIQNIVW